MENYLKLEQEIEQVYQIDNVISLLQWDIAVNMPVGAVESREQEMTTLSLIVQRKLKSETT